MKLPILQQWIIYFKDGSILYTGCNCRERKNEIYIFYKEIAKGIAIEFKHHYLINEIESLGIARIGALNKITYS